MRVKNCMIECRQKNNNKKIKNSKFLRYVICFCVIVYVSKKNLKIESNL